MPREHPRRDTLAELGAEIGRLNRGRATDEPGRQSHTKAVCALKSHPTRGRFVRELNSGQLRIERAAVKAEGQLDGKHVVMTSVDSLSAEDVALGYTLLSEVQAAWRTLKTDLDLPPMNHGKADRFRTDVLRRWLALPERRGQMADARLLARQDVENAQPCGMGERLIQLGKLLVGVHVAS